MTNRPWDKEREALRALLKDLRKNKARLTQIELSVLLGKPQSYVSKYETGERKLDYVDIRHICQAVRISMRRFNELYEERLKKS